MTETMDVTTSRLMSVLDEAESTLTWATSGKRPAVMRMARLRPVLAAAGYGAMTVEALSLFTVGAPAVSETLNETCRGAATVLDYAIGPELAARWTVDGVVDQLAPETVAAGIDPDLVSTAMLEHAVARVETVIERSIGVLVEIVEDESVLPDLREAAEDAVHVLTQHG